MVALTGDGGLLMCVGELLTAVRERLRIITIVFSDASLSLIEIKQQAAALPASGVALGAIDWAGAGRKPRRRRPGPRGDRRVSSIARSSEALRRARPEPDRGEDRPIELRRHAARRSEDRS